MRPGDTATDRPPRLLAVRPPDRSRIRRLDTWPGRPAPAQRLQFRLRSRAETRNNGPAGDELMPCEWYELPGGGVAHIHRSKSRGPKRHCKFCNTDYYGGKLCDFPIGNGRTCDAQLCDNCSQTLGRQASLQQSGLKRLNDTIDVCPLHRGMAVVTKGTLQPGPAGRTETPNEN